MLNSANDAPETAWDWAVVPMNGSGRTIPVLDNDLDPDGDTLTVTLPGPTDPGYPLHGTVTVLTATGQPDTVRYVPAPTYFGTDEFVYTVNDGHGGTVTGSVSVLVYKLSIGVSPGFWVPGASPARWAVPVGDAGRSVQLVVMSEPSGVDFSTMSVAWTGATVDPDYSAYAYRDQSQTGAASVSVLVTDTDSETISADAEVVVVGIDHIASDSTVLHVVDADNAVTGVGTDPSTVEVIALLTPSTPDVSAVYDKLIVWIYGGNTGSTPDRRAIDRTAPAQAPLTARCGVSTDSLDVWAVQVKLHLGGVADADKMEDAHAVQLVLNTNDDNRNGLADVNESNGVQGLGIAGESDLALCATTVLPADVPFGAVVLDVPSALAVCTELEKLGGRITAPTWDLADGPLPAGAYLEGVSLCTPQTLTVRYTWNTLDMSEDQVKVTVGAQPELGAKSTLLLYPLEAVRSGGSAGSSYHAPGGSYGAATVGGTYAAAAMRPVSGGSALGGDVLVVLKTDLPPGGYLLAAGANFTVYDQAYPEVAGTLAYSFVSGNRFVYDPTRSPEDWDYYNDDPGGMIGATDVYDAPGFTVRDHAVSVATVLTWTTRTAPSLPGWTPAIGTNGTHVIALHELTYTGGGSMAATNLPITQAPVGAYPGGPLDASGPTPVTANIQNLVVEVKRTSAGPGNKDYFAYDPDPDSPTEHHRPWIDFTMASAGSGSHTYEYQIFVQPTSASGFDQLQKDGGYAWLVGTCTPGTKRVTYRGTRGLDQTTEDVAEWSTYTFDVGVIERDASGQMVDWFYYKWPYCLSISNDKETGHNVWISPTEQGDELRSFYKLDDYVNDHQSEYSNFEQPSNINMTPIDNNLNVAGIDIQGGNEVGIKYNGDGQGILVYSNSRLLGTWRVIFTGEDNCWLQYRRDHNSTRMLAINAPAINHHLVPLQGNFDNSPWHAIWVRYEKDKIRVQTIDDHYRNVYTHALAKHQNQPDISFADINGGFFSFQKPNNNAGLVGTGEKRNGSYVWNGENVEAHRWCYGMREDSTTLDIQRLVPKKVGQITLYEPPPGFTDKYPYGLSNIGALVIKEKKQKLTDQAKHFLGTSQRSIVAHATNDDLFLIATANPGWKWEKSQSFIIEELPRIILNNYKLDITITDAVMHDGSGSAQISYFIKGDKGITNWEKGDGRRVRSKFIVICQ